MDKEISVVSRLIELFGDGKNAIEEQGESNMLSIKHIYRGNKPFIPEGTILSNTEYLILNETLIDHFFKIFDSRLIYQEKNVETVLDLIYSFCQKNNIVVHIKQDDNQQLHGFISQDGKDIYIITPTNVNNKDLVYVVLHELSHFIASKASKNKLHKFIKSPLTHDVNIMNVDDIQTELDYFLSPAELANWAFTLSLSLFEEKHKSASEFYKLVKDNVQQEFKSENVTVQLIFSTKFYKSLPENLKVMYNLVVYVRQLKELKIEHRKRLKYQKKLMLFINILNKYVKRLNRLFR